MRSVLTLGACFLVLMLLGTADMPIPLAAAVTLFVMLLRRGITQ